MQFLVSQLRCLMAIALIAGPFSAAKGKADAPPSVPVAAPSMGSFRRSVGPAHQTRSMTIATHGMVATSHPLASLAGLDVLREGGSAADAAIAANAVLGVVEPMSCGIGGDLFVLYWDAKSRRLHGLNASGRSPRGLTREVFSRQGLTEIPLYGPLSWSVPGCVSGWEALHQRFGVLPWDRLFTPAIAHATDGFPVTEVIAGYWKASEKHLQPWPDSVATFLVNGRAPQAGEIFRNPHLAETMRMIATQGARGFYHGDIARAIVTFSQAHGGYFSVEDFASCEPQWVDPVYTTYRGHQVWELPPNGQGIAVLQMLNVLERFDIARWGPGHPDYLHLLIEAKKLAYADRARYYADPDFESVPVAGLIAKDYAKARAAEIDFSRAREEVSPGYPRLSQGDTIYLSVVDKDRNCCSLIQSNFHGFGSQVVPGKLGFALQNRGTLFALDEHHANRLEPGKRPFHTIIPAMVIRDGRPVLCFGVMGGDMQPQGQVQVLINIIDFGMNVQAAGDAARIRHDGSPSPTGESGMPKGGIVAVEPGISSVTRDELIRRGHVIKEESGDGFGGYQAVQIDWERGTLLGATESRKDGMAIGY